MSAPYMWRRLGPAYAQVGAGREPGTRLDNGTPPLMLERVWDDGGGLCFHFRLVMSLHYHSCSVLDV